VSIQKFEAIAVTSESTVVAEYQAEGRKEEAYQSEAQLESAFLELLQGQSYEYFPITV